jgi:hypothetical protein
VQAQEKPERILARYEPLLSGFEGVKAEVMAWRSCGVVSHWDQEQS